MALPWRQWERCADPDNRQNLVRRCPFVDAEGVLSDPLRVIDRDMLHSTDEDRCQAIGMSRSGRLLVVVFVIQEGGIIRLISARRPTRRERHAYEGDP
jgi:uncharacterized DUF497 family protein